MVVHPLYALAEQMQVLRLHCTLQIQQDGELPVFKGSALHGWLGQQLLKQDAELYHVLYAEHESQQPKPYALACHDFRTCYTKNSLLSFQLTLFGSATALAERLVQALCQQTLGLGSARLAVKVHTVASKTPSGLRLGIHPLPLLAWLTVESEQVWQTFCVQLLSPLRLKQCGAILKQEAPSLVLMVNQVQRRLAGLVKFWMDDSQAWQQLLKEHIQLGEYQMLSPSFYFEDWQRYSVARQQYLPFGGLLGEISYQGDIYHALVWLQIGEILQIGGKTSFGLGCYQLIY